MRSAKALIFFWFLTVEDLKIDTYGTRVLYTPKLKEQIKGKENSQPLHAGQVSK